MFGLLMFLLMYWLLDYQYCFQMPNYLVHQLTRC